MNDSGCVELLGGEMVLNQWGYNTYVNADDAEAAARRHFRKVGLQGGADWCIWQLSDGTFDISGIPDPEGPQYPATLVRRRTQLGRGNGS